MSRLPFKNLGIVSLVLVAILFAAMFIHFDWIPSSHIERPKLESRDLNLNPETSDPDYFQPENPGLVSNLLRQWIDSIHNLELEGVRNVSQFLNSSQARLGFTLTGFWNYIPMRFSLSHRLDYIDSLLEENLVPLQPVAGNGNNFLTSRQLGLGYWNGNHDQFSNPDLEKQLDIVSRFIQGGGNPLIESLTYSSNPVRIAINLESAGLAGAFPKMSFWDWLQDQKDGWVGGPVTRIEWDRYVASRVMESMVRHMQPDMVDHHGRNLMHLLARSGMLKEIQSLHKSNSNFISGKDYLNRLPLDIARFYGQTPVVNWLELHSPENPQNFWSQAPTLDSKNVLDFILHFNEKKPQLAQEINWPLFAYICNHKHIAIELAGLGFDHHMIDSEGSSLLRTAFDNRDRQFLRDFIQRIGFDHYSIQKIASHYLSFSDRQTMKYLESAIHISDENFWRYLYQSFYQTGTRSPGFTQIESILLAIASKFEWHSLFKELLGSGADLFSRVEIENLSSDSSSPLALKLALENGMIMRHTEQISDYFSLHGGSAERLGSILVDHFKSRPDKLLAFADSFKKTGARLIESSNLEYRQFIDHQLKQGRLHDVRSILENGFPWPTENVDSDHQPLIFSLFDSMSSEAHSGMDSHSPSKGFQSIFMELVQSYIQLNEGLDVMDQDGCSLWFSIPANLDEKNLKSLMSWLSESGMDINKANGDGITPLHFHIFNGHFSIANLLLKMGADPDLRDDMGYYPLHFAVIPRLSHNSLFRISDQLDVIQLIINHSSLDGPPVDHVGWSPAHYLFLKSSFDSADPELTEMYYQHVFHMLDEAGMSWDRTSDSGINPAHLLHANFDADSVEAISKLDAFPFPLENLDVSHSLDGYPRRFNRDLLGSILSSSLYLMRMNDDEQLSRWVRRSQFLKQSTITKLLAQPKPQSSPTPSDDSASGTNTQRLNLIVDSLALIINSSDTELPLHISKFNKVSSGYFGGSLRDQSYMFGSSILKMTGMEDHVDPLVHALKSNDIERAKALISAGWNPTFFDLTDKGFESPIHLIFQSGDSFLIDSVRNQTASMAFPQAAMVFSLDELISHVHGWNSSIPTEKRISLIFQALSNLIVSHELDKFQFLIVELSALLKRADFEVTALIYTELLAFSDCLSRKSISEHILKSASKLGIMVDMQAFVYPEPRLDNPTSNPLEIIFEANGAEGNLFPVRSSTWLHLQPNQIFPDLSDVILHFTEIPNFLNFLPVQGQSNSLSPGVLDYDDFIRQLIMSNQSTDTK